MSRLDEMKHNCEAMQVAASSIHDIINQTKNLAEANIEQASEIGTEIIQRLNSDICDTSDAALATVEILQNELNTMYLAIENAGG